MADIKISQLPAAAAASGTMQLEVNDSGVSRSVTVSQLNTQYSQSGPTVQFGAGTVTAPSITATGDTNTGIFFPAADTIALVEGGVEALRVTSAGQVGIGTTAPGCSLEVNGGIRARGGAPGASGINNNGYAFSGGSGDNDSGMFSSADGRLEFYTNSVERLRIASDGSLSSVIPGGSTLYPEYACRAWVNFNGVGTVAIRGSGNVTSITDVGVGRYVVNLTTAMPDINYSVGGMAQSSGPLVITFDLAGTSATPLTTTTIPLRVETGGSTSADTTTVTIAAFR